MPSTELLAKADQAMRICNACRYCEGFCAVFPAMERHRTFSPQDLKYLANLCHDCRGCYYACQYAPPHEFDLNLPRTLAELRLATYREFCRPRFLTPLLRHSGLAAGLITVLSVIAVLIRLVVVKGSVGLFAPHLGAGAFYEVVPYPLMVIPMLLIVLGVLVLLLLEVVDFWRHSGAGLNDLIRPQANLRAMGDALRLKHLGGGGHGCNYPDERFSTIRRWFHHWVFYGFGLCLASTATAAIYEHVLHRQAPYPFWRWSVVLGTLGGVSLVIGTLGFLYLKRQMDTTPADGQAKGLDVGFILLLLLTSLTGLLLLLFRATPAMGVLLAVHLGTVLGFFVTLPYGKFVHALFRYAALVRNAAEQSREGQ
jgi:citrate/tricarballylate utilization protein